eukprot:TRINITY_DN9643_c0_g1_i1.p1 TRINITY_DN9643_c0_g1~~TRINITY_DN9643_c0_g1_i1.p1  ORF type:complete len:188 (+),score=40.42 TRINITY_DN9643_c0_g1_i1:26-565(+)
MGIMQIDLIMMGPYGVGISTLTTVFTEDRFEQEYLGTIEEEFKKEVEIDGDKVNVRINEIYGMEEFSSLAEAYLKRADGVIMVYSINSRESLQFLNQMNLPNWSWRAREGTVPMILIGNMIDLEDERQVSSDEGEIFAKSLGIEFVETSAKRKWTVDNAFMKIIRDAVQKKKIFEEKKR